MSNVNVCADCGAHGFYVNLQTIKRKSSTQKGQWKNCKRSSKEDSHVDEAGAVRQLEKDRLRVRPWLHLNKGRTGARTSTRKTHKFCAPIRMTWMATG